MPKDQNKANINATDIKVNSIKSGLEEKIDVLKPSTPKNDGKNKIDDANVFGNTTKLTSQPEVEKSTKPTPDKPNYIEILTVEPNNTNVNKSSNSILEVLKNIMPMLNSSVTKDLHSITIIERNQNKNHSFSETKNISTIIVKYCDKENLTKDNLFDSNQFDEDLKAIDVQKNDDEYDMDDYLENDDGEHHKMSNITIESRKDVLEAAEYGMMKMHELYGVLEPKLYSMGKSLSCCYSTAWLVEDYNANNK